MFLVSFPAAFVFFLDLSQLLDNLENIDSFHGIVNPALFHHFHHFGFHIASFLPPRVDIGAGSVSNFFHSHLVVIDIVKVPEAGQDRIDSVAEGKQINFFVHVVGIFFRSAKLL